MKHHIGIIIGTRPEIIKMSPVIKALQDKNISFFVIHTGQHYSYSMDAVFIEELVLPKPQYNLEVGSGTHGAQTGKMLEKIEVVCSKEKPTAVLVQGDTNSVLAGALVAAKMHIPVGHIEAGLRSFDRSMPEEINRVVTDHIAEYLFAPTQASADQLVKEGIEKEKVFITGNTVVDAVLYAARIAEEKSEILSTLNVQKNNFILTTMHRQENVDDKERVLQCLTALQKIGQEMQMPILFPMHPRTKKQLTTFALFDELVQSEWVQVIEPVGFFDFLHLEQSARLIITDSGGLQEEACILKVPCVTLRDNTERPESVTVGANILAGADVDTIVAAAQEMLERDANWQNPFGDGTAGSQIVDILTNS